MEDLYKYLEMKNDSTPDSQDKKPDCYEEDRINFRIVSIEGYVGLVVPNSEQLKNRLLYKYLNYYSLDTPMVEDIEQHKLLNNSDGSELILIGKDVVSPITMSLSAILDRNKKYRISTILYVTVKEIEDVLSFSDRYLLCIPERR